MPGLAATHSRIGGPILHQRPQKRAVAFRAALVMSVSSTAGVLPANGAGHAANGTAQRCPVLKFGRRDTGDTTFKTILSIDGGGLRGLVPAGMLEGVEDMIKQVAIENKLVGEDEHGKSVQVTKDTPFSVVLADYFDVVAGTSTGSIVATYVATKGKQATALHTADSFKPAVAKGRQIKANVSTSGAPSATTADFADTPPHGSAAAVQALFLSTCQEIFPPRSLFNTVMSGFWPKYPADYRRRSFWTPLGGEKAGIERVLQSAFGGDDVLMSKPDLLASSLVVTSYQLDYDRPFIFYCSTKDQKSGYASLRRTLAGAKEVLVIDPHDHAAKARLDNAGQSDLVRLEQEFRLWEVVRASTAAPTFFATAAVNILSPKDPKDPDGSAALAQKDGKPLAPMRMTDGGVVANNPSMLGLNFAAGEYDTQFVADKTKPGRPSLAVLSLGCGTTSQLSDVKPRAGLWGWAVKGPIIEILQGGQGELSAAIFQELSREWPGSGKYQSLRLQLTAGLDQDGNETLSYSEDVVTLPKDHTAVTGDPRVGRFQQALKQEKGDPLRANDVLRTMDVVDQAEQLLGLGHAVVADSCVQEKLEFFVKKYVLADAPVPASKATSHGAATAAAGA